MSVIAQAERKMISSRTKAALAEARKRVAVAGQREEHSEIKRLGCPTGAAHLQGQGFDRLAVQALKAKADERAAGLAASIDALKTEGVRSANALAGALNARGYATARGGRWTARSVLNVMARLRAVGACVRARNALRGLFYSLKMMIYWPHWPEVWSFFPALAAALATQRLQVTPPCTSSIAARLACSWMRSVNARKRSISASSQRRP